jgi:hypothetical protein
MMKRGQGICFLSCDDASAAKYEQRRRHYWLQLIVSPHKLL